MNKEIVSNNFWDSIKTEIEVYDLINRFKTSSAKQLDKELNYELKPLIKVLSRLDEKERKYFIEAISNILDLYIENKIEKELEKNFVKLLNPF
jgi:hypothetical protein